MSTRKRIKIISKVSLKEQLLNFSRDKMNNTLDNEDDTEFMIAFGRKRNAPKKNLLPASEKEENTQGNVSSPRFRLPERVIAREARKHNKAVNTLLRRGDTARALALDGLAALEQSDSVGTISSDVKNENDKEGVESLDAEDEDDVMVLLDQAFRQALEAEEETAAAEVDTVDFEIILRLWSQCYSIADRMLQRATSIEESDGPARAMMASLSHQAIYLERQGKLRAALESLDKAVELSKKTACDAVMLKGVSRLLKSAGKLCQRLGSIETMHKKVLKAVEIDDFLEEKGFSSGSDSHSGDNNRVREKEEGKEKKMDKNKIQVQEGTENSKGTNGNDRMTTNVTQSSSLSTSTQKSQSHANIPTTGTPTEPLAIKNNVTTITSPLAAAVSLHPVSEKILATLPPPPQSPPLVPSTLPTVTADGSANSLFVSAAKSAMFQQDFQQLLHLLNRALLGDMIASEALWLSMPVANVTLLMVASGSDRSDLVKRLIGLLPVKDVQTKIVTEKDVTGSNAIAHACTLGRSSSLDALLRRLSSAKITFTPFAPTPGGPLEKASLVDVGISLQQAQSYSPLIQAQLRFFVADPEAYAKSTIPVPMNKVWSAPLPQLPQLLHPILPLPLRLAEQQAFLANLLTVAQSSGPPFPHLLSPNPSPFISSSTSSSYVAPDAPTLPPPPAAFLSPRNTAKTSHVSPPSIPLASTQTRTTSQPTKTSNATTATTTTTTTNIKDRARPTPQAPQVIPQLTPNVSKAAGEGKLVGRQLVAWTTNEVDDINNKNALISEEGELLDSGLSSSSKGGGSKNASGGARFDQFKVNEEKFGLKATFDESQYTTSLDAKAFTKEQIEAADLLAAEIKAMEGTEFSNNPHVRDERGQAVSADDDDEEALYSAVLGNRGGAAVEKDTFTDLGVAKAHSRKGK